MKTRRRWAYDTAYLESFVGKQFHADSTSTIIAALPRRRGRAFVRVQCGRCPRQYDAVFSVLMTGKYWYCMSCIRKAAYVGAGGRTRMAHLPEHSVWRSINRRCFTESNAGYYKYGARGITVCQRWRDDFWNFYADMGQRPSAEHQIDRKDNNGNYSCGKCHECLTNGWPANCRWATRAIQSRNTRRTRMVTINGKTQCIADWCKEFGIRDVVVRNRISTGWEVIRAITTPLLK